MYAKLRITGVLEVATGLHIGASGAFSAIGAVDSPIIKDALESDKPLIPGSSLKGKIRTLLARQYYYESGKTMGKPENDSDIILRLFGCSKNKDYRTARLIFSDMMLANAVELRKRGVDNLTEVKFENTINRLTAEANPRQIERAIRGSRFNLDIIYEVAGQDESEITEDFALIADGLKLLQCDYLGGNGSRGYGKVVISDLRADVAAGEVNESLIEKVSNLLTAV